MPNFGVLLAPLVLMMPFPGSSDDARQNTSVGSAGLTVEPKQVHAQSAQAQSVQAQSAQSKSDHVWVVTEGANGMPIQYQVRIEQRVTIRVAPRRPVVRRNLTADLPQREQPRRLVERKIGKCVNMKGIVGVTATRDNRLMLYMRDKKLIAANLEKACTARDFYSGFYVEPSKDGNLCIQRDKVQSRTGVKCQLDRLRQLVPE